MTDNIRDFNSYDMGKPDGISTKRSRTLSDDLVFGCQDDESEDPQDLVDFFERPRVTYKIGE